MSNKQQITSTDLRKYRTELPNIYDDAGLDVYEFRLLAHYVRVGNCYESVRTTAKKCNMSHPTVIRARDTLKKKGFINVTLQEDYDTLLIRVIDLWPENYARYDDGNEIEQVVERLNGVVERLNGGGSLVERGGREIESKKEPIKKNSIKNEPNKNLLKALSVWAEYFPNKPQPRATTKSIQNKWNTRYKDEHFRDNWKKALLISSKSSTLQTESWFSFDYFVKNDNNYQKMLNDWMAWKDENEYDPRAELATRLERIENGE